MTRLKKPQGPIWTDFAPMLLNDLPVSKVISMANLAMNRLTLRDCGEIFHDLGIDVRMELRDLPPEDDAK